MADSQTPNGVPIRDDGPRPKLLDRVRGTIRMRHYSRRTEATYVHWIRRFIVFHRKKHPSTMGAREIAAFLSWLATDQRVSSSTQNQALSALLFLYRHVLRIEVGAIEQVPRAKMPHRVPVVLSREEVGAILKYIEGAMRIVVALLYGAGLRLQQCLELRVKDIDFDRHEIIVRRGKGQKDRRTMLPVASQGSSPAMAASGAGLRRCLRPQRNKGPDGMVCVLFFEDFRKTARAVTAMAASGDLAVHSVRS